MAEKETKSEITPEVSPDEYIESLKKALEEEKSKAVANLAGWQRAQADFVNYKRFVEQEKLETSKPFKYLILILLKLTLKRHLQLKLQRKQLTRYRELLVMAWLQIIFKLNLLKFHDGGETQIGKPIKRQIRCNVIYCNKM